MKTASPVGKVGAPMGSRNAAKDKGEIKPSDRRVKYGENATYLAARELGIESTAAKRAMQIGTLAPEAKQAAVEMGLADTGTALLQAAKAAALIHEPSAHRPRDRQDRKGGAA